MLAAQQTTLYFLVHIFPASVFPSMRFFQCSLHSSITFSVSTCARAHQVARWPAFANGHIVRTQRKALTAGVVYSNVDRYVTYNRSRSQSAVTGAVFHSKFFNEFSPPNRTFQRVPVSGDLLTVCTMIIRGNLTREPRQYANQRRGYALEICEFGTGACVLARKKSIKSFGLVAACDTYKRRLTNSIQEGDHRQRSIPLESSTNDQRGSTADHRYSTIENGGHRNLMPGGTVSSARTRFRASSPSTGAHCPLPQMCLCTPSRLNRNTMMESQASPTTRSTVRN